MYSGKICNTGPRKEGRNRECRAVPAGRSGQASKGSHLEDFLSVTKEVGWENGDALQREGWKGRMESGRMLALVKQMQISGRCTHAHRYVWLLRVQSGWLLERS